MPLGRSFQGGAAVRRLSPVDHAALAAFALGLPLEARARPVDEERLERMVARATTDPLDATPYELRARVDDRRRTRLLREAPRRSRGLVEALRRMYRGRCQLCGWESHTAHAVDVCEAHHRQWLSRGGDDATGNLVLLCPNHHRLVHALDAPLPWPQA